MEPIETIRPAGHIYRCELVSLDGGFASSWPVLVKSGQVAEPVITVDPEIGMASARIDVSGG